VYIDIDEVRVESLESVPLLGCQLCPFAPYLEFRFYFTSNHAACVVWKMFEFPAI
jgi:hypothetical protein